MIEGSTGASATIGRTDGFKEIADANGWNILDSQTGDFTQAESSRRDTNMNMEMVQYSTNRILVQASQSILAQYNDDAKYVLEMLK